MVLYGLKRGWGVLWVFCGARCVRGFDWLEVGLYGFRCWFLVGLSVCGFFFMVFYGFLWFLMWGKYGFCGEVKR